MKTQLVLFCLFGVACSSGMELQKSREIARLSSIHQGLTNEQEESALKYIKEHHLSWLIQGAHCSIREKIAAGDIEGMQIVIDMIPNEVKYYF